MSDNEDRGPTFEEASRCPKCDRPGKEVACKPGARRGVMVHVIECVTELCKWHGERWFVQVNDDGSIPKAYSQIGKKQYQTISKESETRINEAIQSQLDAETRKGGGEIRGRF